MVEKKEIYSSFIKILYRNRGLIPLIYNVVLNTYHINTFINDPRHIYIDLQ